MMDGRPIPTLYRLPWLLLGFGPWYLWHLLFHPFRRVGDRPVGIRQRHRAALYDGVLHLMLLGYASLAGRRLRRGTGRIIVTFTRIAFAFDDEYERRRAAGSGVDFDDVFHAPEVQKRLREWRALMSAHPAYPAIRDYLQAFVRSLYRDYLTGQRTARDEFAGLLHAATLDSGGLLVAVVTIIAMTQEVPLRDGVATQFTALGVLGKLADDMIDLRADHAARRANLLEVLIRDLPAERRAWERAVAQGERTNTVWWRRHCPRAFARYRTAGATAYAQLGSRWLRFASHLLWVPALLGRSTTNDVRGRL
jgi:hypothetical protein